MTSVAKTLRTLAQNLGAAAVAAYGTVPNAPSPVPSLVIPPSSIAPVVDCGDLLLVNATGITSAFQGPPEKCALVLQASLSVTVTRCIPNLTDFARVAEHADLTAASLSLADDVSTLWYGITSACRAGTLWAGFAGLECADTDFREARPGASGGVAWWTFPIVVRVSTNLL